MKNKILFITATHGDEGFSIKVFEELERGYPTLKKNFKRIVGNPKALAKNIRYTDKDLNRSAPGNIKSRLYEEKRAAEIMETAKKFEYVVDIHGANSKCGVVIIISKPLLENIIFSSMFPIKRVVIWYTRDSLANGPLTQFCEPQGLEIECGPKNSKKVQEKLKRVLVNFLNRSSKVSRKKLIENMRKKEFYVISGLEKNGRKKFSDFLKTKIGNETFYPFMSNQYPGINCYKLKRIKIEDLFLTQL